MRDSGPTPRFTTRRSILFATIIAGGFLALAEGAARLVGVKDVTRPAIIARSVDVDIDFPFMRPDPVLMWSPRPGFAGSFLDRPLRINSLGMRGPEIQVPKPPGRRRIGCFGDSITFGYGVGDGETYCALLDAKLRPGGIEAVNAAVTGYTSHQALLRFDAIAGAAELDAALFLVGWNDQTLRPVDDRSYSRQIRNARVLEGLATHLQLYRLMRNLYIRAVAPPMQPGSTQRVPPAHYRENLVRLVAACRARHVAPAFLPFPRRRHAGEPAVTSPHEDVLRDVARTEGVPVFSIGLLDARAADANDSLFIDSIHLSPAGHAYLAERLVEQLPGSAVLSSDGRPAWPQYSTLASSGKQ